MKKYLARFGTYLLDFEAALLIGLLVETFAPLPVLVTVELSRFALRIIHTALFVLSTTAWLFVSARTIGYKTKEFHLNDVLIPGVSVFILQQVLSPIFTYAEYVSGGALPLTYAMFLGDKPLFAGPPSFIADGVPRWGYHICMLLLVVTFYLPAMIGGEYLGAKKREKERTELLKNAPEW